MFIDQFINHLKGNLNQLIETDNEVESKSNLETARRLFKEQLKKYEVEEEDYQNQEIMDIFDERIKFVENFDEDE